MDDLPIRVIPSEEVKTSEGEIIGYFLSELVPKGLTPEETVKRIKDQGGLVGVPHPFDSMRTASRLRTEALDRLVQADLVDILEVFNARSHNTQDNDRALHYAKKHNLAMSAGSDAHTLREVGRAYVEVPPFDTAEEFLEALRKGKINGIMSSRLIHIGSTFATVVKQLPIVGSRLR
jgi:predicted metal-dependent phosphoesterase TrpH